MVPAAAVDQNIADLVAHLGKPETDGTFPHFLIVSSLWPAWIESSLLTFRIMLRGAEMLGFSV
jgi:hypothetical protein